MAEHYDVVVVGAGLVGVTCTALLARQGLSVCLLHREPFAVWQGDDHHPRVSAINIAAMEIFRTLGVWRDIVAKRVCPYHAMEVWEHGTNATIRFDSRELGAAELGYIIENDAITTSILAKLEHNFQVSLRPQHALRELKNDADGLTVYTDSAQLQCNLLVGADGARSMVRQLCGIQTNFLDYHQDAIITTVALQEHHQHTAWQSFQTTGPIALLPLSDGRCSVVWSCDREHSDAIMALDEPGLCAALTQVFATKPGPITGCRDRHRFPLRQHHATTYIARGVALVGDAAHVVHPLAGLGANIGLLDAAALARVVEQAKARGQPIARRSVLRRYERERKGENELVLQTLRAFKTVFGSTHPLPTTLRRLGLNTADALPFLKNCLAGFARQRADG